MDMGNAWYAHSAINLCIILYLIAVCLYPLYLRSPPMHNLSLTHSSYDSAPYVSYHSPSDAGVSPGHRLLPHPNCIARILF